VTQPRAEGLQAERTRLAWRRSVLAGGVTILLLGHEALRHGGLVPATLAVAGAATWLTWALVAQRRIHAMTDPRPVAQSTRAVVLSGVLVLTLAAVSVAAVLA
jgi:hypothetical protein